MNHMHHYTTSATASTLHQHDAVWLAPSPEALDAAQQDILVDAFKSDPSWCGRSSCLRLDNPDAGSATGGRIVVELFPDAAPKAVENFLCLCSGEKGVGKSSKKALHYKVCMHPRS